MIEYILMGVMAALVLGLMILRTNTAICFLALCAGSVLLSSSGDNVSLLASSLTSGISTSTNVARIILLLTPFAVCAIMLRHHVHKSLMPLAFIPAVCTALLAVIFVTPLLSDGTEGSIVATETWEILIQYQELLMGLGLVTSIVLLAFTIKKPHEKHHKKRH